MGGLEEVVFRATIVMFDVLLQRFAKDTHNMYLSLFCGNLTTIDFHDNLGAGQIPGGS